MPTTQLQLRRGNTAQTAIFTGAVGEVTVDTQKKTLIVHDGVTAGGTEIALQVYANAAYHAANNAGSTAADAYQHAGSASSYANSAYGQANTATTNAATADQRAVTSGVYANSAYAAANTADQKAISAGSYANGAFEAANTANTWLQSYVGTQISNLVDSAPTTLDTLNELAAALGDDANFSTTITTMVGTTGSYANSAYTQANTATTNATTADQRAVTSGSYANSAYSQANTGTILAQAAFNAANTAGGADTWARDTANAAFNKANTLFVGEETLTTNTANQVIDSYSTTEYRTAKYIVQAISGADVHSEEILVTHNDTDVFFTEYAVLTTANSLFDVYATIQSSNVTVNVSPINTETQIDFSRISIIARTLASLEGDLMSLSGTEDLETGSGTVDLMA